MDTPEQPTTWPPAPTVAPPEAEQSKPFKLRLPVPEWGRNWYNSTISFLTAWYIIRGFCEIDQLPCPHWCSFPVACAAGFITGGLMTAWKYRPRRKKE